MAKSRRSAPGLVVLLVGGLVGCDPPDRGKDRGEETTTTKSALTTSLFEPHVTYSTGSRARSVAIGDLDGDGRTDVAVSTATNSDPANDMMVHVFLQDTDGSLKPRVRYPTGAATSSIDIGDVNGDGRADLVFAVTSQTAGHVGVLLQNASGTLDPEVSYPTARAPQVNTGDFNGDGRTDVAALAGTTSEASIAVFLQTDTGTLAAPVTYPIPRAGNELDVGDVDGDGRVDLVVVSGWSNVSEVSVLLQLPDGTLGAATSYPLGINVNARGIAVGDTNGDGRTDVVLSYGGSPPNSFIARFLQNAQGALDVPVSFPSRDNPSAIVLADVDADGRKDILVTHDATGWLGVYRQFPSGGFVKEELVTVPTGTLQQPQSLAVGDVNGDGRADVVIANEFWGLVVLRHVADTSLGLAITSPAAGGNAYVGFPLTVRWTAGDVVPLATFDVAVSFNGGSSYTPIAGCTGLPATATECPWTPPGAGNGVRVRVTAQDTGGQTAFAESTFNVVTPSISFSGPSLIQGLYIGTPTTISWFHNLPATDTVRIELSRDGGTSYEMLAAAVPISGSGSTSGSFVWNPTGPATQTARLRVSANGSPSATVTSINFEIITPPVVEIVVFTTGGVAYTSGLSVAWTRVPGVSSFRLELSRDGGATYQLIASALSEGGFGGAVPGPGSADARVRVTANGSIPATATSASFSLVEPTLAVTNPAAGGTAYVGVATSITWATNLPASSSARIELSRDGGSTYQALATSAPNTGSFAWSVDGPATAAARVRVTVTTPGTTVATSGTFAIVAPSLIVTGPTTSAPVYVGAQVPITWTTNLPATLPVTVEVSRDVGGSYEVLAAGAPNTGAFNWVATGPAVSAAVVRVTIGGVAAQRFFSIVQPSLTVTGPANGASFLTGTSVPITWTTNLPSTSSAIVELSRDGGASYATIAIWPNNGSFNWAATGPATSAARVRVTITGPGGMSATSGTFSIVQPSLTVTGPGAGASFYAGTPMAITWTTNLPATSPVTIELSRDGGSYEILATGAPNTGSFAALATGPSTGAARVRVTVGGTPSLSATSATFAIAEPSLTVTGPAPGAGLYTGTPAAITWTTNLPATSPVLVELSRDGGLTFETLAAAAPNTGSFAWIVSGPDAVGVLARVTIADPVAISSAGGTFAIVSPSLAVTGPAAGTPVYAGAPVTISWTHNVSAGDPVSIELSRDGGATFEVLAAAAANTGSFVWTATGPDSAEARVRVTAHGAVTASGLGPAFSIVTASLAVTSPVAGDSWSIGTARTIAWSSTNLPAGTTVRVELSRDGGASWTTLAAAAPASGSQAWTATAPATSAAIVRVTANGSVPAVASSGAFAIGNPSVSVTAPGAGASWTIGTEQAITWTTNLLPSATVKVQISRNGGGTYTTLASSAPNSGSFLWTAAGAATTTAIIKVSAIGFSANGLSGVFSLVSPSVTVTSPNTAVTWTIGTAQTITWTHNVGAGAQFQIEVSRAGVWSTIAAAAPGGGATTGSYPWTVTGPKASNCKVRVTWVGPATAKDTSDVAFKIN